MKIRRNLTTIFRSCPPPRCPRPPHPPLFILSCCVKPVWVAGGEQLRHVVPQVSREVPSGGLAYRHESATGTRRVCFFFFFRVAGRCRFCFVVDVTKSVVRVTRVGEKKRVRLWSAIVASVEWPPWVACLVVLCLPTALPFVLFC